MRIPRRLAAMVEADKATLVAQIVDLEAENDLLRKRISELEKPAVKPPVHKPVKAGPGKK